MVELMIGSTPILKIIINEEILRQIRDGKTVKAYIRIKNRGEVSSGEIIISETDTYLSFSLSQDHLKTIGIGKAIVQVQYIEGNTSTLTKQGIIHIIDSLQYEEV